MGKIVSKAELSKFLGKDEKTIFRWLKEGLPIEKQGKRGTSSHFDTEKVVEWLIARSGNGKEMEHARIRLTNAQADKTELEVRELQGELISLEKMKLLWGSILGRFRSRVLSMPSRLTPVISTIRDPKKIEKIIKDALYEALNELAEYDPETDKTRKGSRTGSDKDRSSAATS